MSNNYPLPKGYRDNIHKGDNNNLPSRQGLIGKLVTDDGSFHRLFVPSPLRGWKSLTLSMAIPPNLLDPVSGTARCLVFVCNYDTPDTDIYGHLVDVVDFSSKNNIFSYYRSPMTLSQDETIVIKSNTAGVCVRAEGNDESRFSL